MSQSSDEEEFYEVEGILDDKVDIDGEKLYYIKWKNYDPAYYNTWEPEENLSCPELLQTYLESKRKKDGKKRKRKGYINKNDQSEPPIKKVHAEGSGASNSSNASSNKSSSNKDKHKSISDTNLEKSAGPLSISDTMQSFLTKPIKAVLSSATTSSGITSPSPSPTPPSTKADQKDERIHKKTNPGSSWNKVIVDVDEDSDSDEDILSMNVLKEFALREKGKSADSTTTQSQKRANKDNGISANSSHKQKAAPLSLSISPNGQSVSTFGVIKRTNQQLQQQKTPLETLMDGIDGSRSSINKLRPILPLPSPSNSKWSKTQTTVEQRARYDSHRGQQQQQSRSDKYHNQHHVDKNPKALQVYTGRDIAKKPSPPIIWTGVFNIKKLGSYPVQILLDQDSSGLSNNAVSFLNGMDLVANTVLPYRLVKHLSKGSDCCIMEGKPSDNRSLVFSKLWKFLRNNKLGVVVLSPKHKTEAILIANQFKMDDPGTESMDSLSVVYIKDLVPDVTPKNIPRSPSLLSSPQLHPNWKAACAILSFPEELIAFGKRTDVTFEVFGNSELAKLLKFACKCTTHEEKGKSTYTTKGSSSSTAESLSPATKRLLLFDRSDDMIYNKPLKDERTSADTRIFQFGYTSVIDPITPALEVYPKNSGGFITTDVRNILHNPDILDRLVQFVHKNNDLLLGEYRVILHPEILQHIMRAGTGLPAVDAITKIMGLLHSNDINVMENWSEVPDESRWKTASLDWFNAIIRDHLNTYQLFYFVDDMAPPNTYQSRYPFIDFIPSDRLLV